LAFQGCIAARLRLRIGRHFGKDRFEQDRDFFRATIDSAVCR